MVPDGDGSYLSAFARGGEDSAALISDRDVMGCTEGSLPGCTPGVVIVSER